MVARLESVDTLRWQGDVLEMIDQRLLPAQFVYVRCHTARDVADAIQTMVVRGAPAIGCAAACGLALEAGCQKDLSLPEFKRAMAAATELLAKSRPTAINLAWGLARMNDLIARDKTSDPRAIARVMLAEARAVLAEDVRINRAMGAHGAKLLKDGMRVFTHCNAGALAAAGHGTALGVVRSAIEAGKRLTMIAGETRPFLQGARLTAWELVESGIPVTLITDSMSGHLMSRGEIDAVIVGADRVAANGDVANKIGTYMVAVLAKRHAIPFYVACPTSTFDMSLASGEMIPIEERDASEVTGYGGSRWAAEGVAVRNPAFDITPASLITAIITEKGVIHAPDVAGLIALMS